MELREAMSDITTVMQKTKEMWVASQHETTDIAIYIHCWRDEEIAVSVQCPLDRDTALHAAWVAIPGFCADIAAMTFESYHSELTESPLTGSQWRPREMQYVALTQPEALDKGWVSECLTTLIHGRDGNYGMFSVPYRIVDGQVTWGPPAADHFSTDTDRLDESGGGRMFESLQASMAQPTIEEIIEQQAAENPLMSSLNVLIDDPEERAFHRDMATLRALKDKELITHAVIAAHEGSLRERLINERMGNHEVMGDLADAITLRVHGSTETDGGDDL